MNSAYEWWSDDPAKDVTITIGLVSVHLALALAEWAPTPVSDLSVSNRFTLALALAGVAGVVVGFTASALTVYASLAGGERLSHLRSQVGAALERTWAAVIRDPVIVVAAFVVAAIWADTGWSAWVIEAATVLLIARLSRLSWLLNHVITFGVKDVSDAREPTRTS